jgi:hypothetical protein
MCYALSMRKLSTKWFKKWSKKSKINNHDLLDTIDNLIKGLSTADLGSNLFKIRVKRKYSGKSSGFRTIIVYKEGEKAIFLYGFAKNERENISKTEFLYFKKLGNDLLALNENQIKQLIKTKSLFEIEAIE